MCDGTNLPVAVVTNLENDDMKTDLNVLLVDDNEQMRELLTLLLSRECAHVTAVSDGQQAIERLSRTPYPFDLVISDVEMPHSTGWDLLA